MEISKKRGYYIHFQGRLSIGVSKKIDMQLEEFSRYYEMKEIEIQTPERTLLERILGLFPTASIARDYVRGFRELDAPDFIYVRRTVADRKYVRFLRDIKKKYPDCKIVIEIFTYPYDRDDFAKWNAWPFYIKEILNRGKLKKYVDRFVTYTDDKEIFGVPTIRTMNGVNVEKINIVKGEWKENKITLIGVAYMQRQHGYERVIEGINNYYQHSDHNYEVELLLVGDGPEKQKYQKMVQKYNLHNYVKFYSTISGKDLDEKYNSSDVALAAFGMYKNNVNKLSALKTRECLAKGMPIVTGCEIDVLNDDFKFVKNYPNMAQSLDIMEIIKFYEKIKAEYGTKREVADIIREFARQHVNIDLTMKPIIDFLKI